MFCGKCGSQIQNGHTFCSKCGGAIAGASTPIVKLSEQKNYKMMILLGTAVAVVVAVVAILLMLLLSNPEGKATKVAEKFAESYYSADYKGVVNTVAYDVDEMFYDMLCYYCDEHWMTVDEGIEELEEEFHITIRDTDDLLKNIFHAYAAEWKEEEESYRVEAEAVHSREMTRRELEKYIEDNNRYYNDLGVEIEDYVDVDKIKKAYTVDVRVTHYYGEDWEDHEETYAVIKQKGGWKILTLLDMDLDG